MVNYYVTKRNGKSIRRHRLIAEQMLGRPLIKGEIVHHKNEKIRDDRLKNLKIVTPKEHSHIHNYVLRIKIKCNQCRKTIKIRKKLYLWKKKNRVKHFYCSNRCSGFAQKSEKERQLLNNLIINGFNNKKVLYQIAKDNNIDKDKIYNHCRYMVKNKLLKKSDKIQSDKIRLKNGLYKCSKCNNYLSKNNYDKNKNKSYGINSYCKFCRKLYKI